MFNVLMEGARSGGIPFMQDDNILAFARTILGGDLLKDSIDLTSVDFQDAQREALTKTANDFLKQAYSAFGSLDTPE